MSEMFEITIGIPVKLLEAIDQAVAHGEYASRSEVIVDAMRIWVQARTFERQSAEVEKSNPRSS